MLIQTTRFGPMEVDAKKVIHFPNGLLGFPETKDFIIFDHDRDVPFKWLQAIHEPDLAFVIMDPFLVDPQYHVEVEPQDLEVLGVHDIDSLILFVILTIPPGDPTRITANLRGPVVVSEENLWAKQLVLVNSPYHTRHPLLSRDHDVESHAGTRT